MKRFDFYDASVRHPFISIRQQPQQHNIDNNELELLSFTYSLQSSLPFLSSGYEPKYHALENIVCLKRERIRTKKASIPPAGQSLRCPHLIPQSLTTVIPPNNPILPSNRIVPSTSYTKVSLKTQQKKALLHYSHLKLPQEEVQALKDIKKAKTDDAPPVYRSQDEPDLEIQGIGVQVQTCAHLESYFLRLTHRSPINLTSGKGPSACLK